MFFPEGETRGSKIDWEVFLSQTNAKRLARLARWKKRLMLVALGGCGEGLRMFWNDSALLGMMQNVLE